MRRYVEIAIAAACLAFLVAFCFQYVKAQMELAEYVEKLTVEVTARCKHHGGTLVKTPTEYKCIKAAVLY